MSSSLVSDEQLRTILASATTFMNSRPLSVVSNDVEDIPPLTPASFLQLATGRLDPLDEPRDGSLLKTQAIADALWKRFIKEILPHMNPRTRWWNEVSGLKVGDVVIVLKDDCTRVHWPLGQITELFQGRDDQNRVARVKLIDRTSYKVKVMTRPVVKLIPVLQEQEK